VEEDGNWLRCNRCQHVFFKDHPKKASASAGADQGAPFESKDRKSDAAAGDQDAPFREARTAKPYGAAQYFDDMEMEDGEEAELYEGKVYGGPEKKRLGGKIGKLAAYAVIAVLIIIILAIWTFPPVGEKVFLGLSNLQDFFIKMTGGEGKSGQFDLSKMKIINVKQRYLNNLLVGSIRVVEGTIVNQSKFYISNIKVQCELADAYGVALAKKDSYCGNRLTDEELVIKTEDEIFRELANPLGSDVSNERVAPGSEIPFMIVFIREPAGGAKATVSLSGAERLLP
jgi:hypothetical protein